MKLEAGKYYLNRRGERVGPLVFDDALGIYRDNNLNKDLGWWFPTGRFIVGRESEHDLVDVWKDKEKWLKVGEYYDYKKNFPLPGPVARAKCIEVIGETAVMVVWRHANPNGMVELANFYTALVSVENTGGKYRPIVDAPAAFQEEQFEFPEANAEQPF